MILKGAQKKMIVVKTADSDIFEEAYFVVKANGSGGDKDMIAEANRIIEERRIQPSGAKEKKPRRKAVHYFLCGLLFTLGMFIGAFVTLLLLLAV